MATSRALISVVSPVYEEEEVLPHFHRVLGEVLDGLADDYDAEIHAAFPRITGGKIKIWALDPGLGDQLDLFVDLAHEVDGSLTISGFAGASDLDAGVA